MPQTGLHDNLRLAVQELSENLMEFTVNPTRFSPVLTTHIIVQIV